MARSIKRKGPRWLHTQPERALHGIYWRHWRLMATDGLSEAQSWLMDRLANELRWRRQRAVPADRCNCDICLPIEEDEEVARQLAGQLAMDLGDEPF